MLNTVSLTGIIPTFDPKRPLRRALQSAARQMQPQDEIIVVGDTADGPLPEIEEVVRSFGSQFRYIPHDAGHHCWGHCGLSAAQTQARGDYLTYCDDDDIWTPTAFGAIRQAASEIQEPMPLLFRLLTHYGLVVWMDQSLRQGTVGGHCLVVPNVPERLGTWTCRYEGDYDAILDTLSRWRKAGVPSLGWCQQVIAIARPGGTEG